MKITLFIGGLIGGGAERVLCNLANYLQENEHEVTIITMSETKETYKLNEGIKIHNLLSLGERKNKILGLPKRFYRLKKYVKTADVDRYVVFLPRTVAFLLFYRKYIKVPVIASERCNPESYIKRTQALIKKYGKRADAWVFQTEDASKWYKGIAKKSYVIPNAINPAFIRPQFEGEKEKTIVAAGRLTEQKNFSLLIEAFAKVSGQHPDYTLKIYGKGPLEEQLKQLAEQKGLADKVEFMGYVDDMPTQLEKASMFVLSSDFEGMPNSLMEAMALGLPCVATDCPCGGPKYLIENGKNGLLVPVGDVDAMAKAIEEMLDNERLRNDCGMNAREIAQKLSPQVIYGKWENCIKETVGEKNGVC